MRGGGLRRGVVAGYEAGGDPKGVEHLPGGQMWGSQRHLGSPPIVSPWLSSFRSIMSKVRRGAFLMSWSPPARVAALQVMIEPCEWRILISWGGPPGSDSRRSIEPIDGRRSTESSDGRRSIEPGCGQRSAEPQLQQLNREEQERSEKRARPCWIPYN
jgi:hypothetical protein